MTTSSHFELNDEKFSGPFKTIYSDIPVERWQEAIQRDTEFAGQGFGGNDFMFLEMDRLSTTAQERRAKIAAAEQLANVQKHSTNKKLHAKRRAWKR